MLYKRIYFLLSLFLVIALPQAVFASEAGLAMKNIAPTHAEAPKLSARDQARINNFLEHDLPALQERIPDITREAHNALKAIDLDAITNPNPMIKELYSRRDKFNDGHFYLNINSSIGIYKKCLIKACLLGAYHGTGALFNRHLLFVDVDACVKAMNDHRDELLPQLQALVALKKKPDKNKINTFKKYFAQQFVNPYLIKPERLFTYFVLYACIQEGLSTLYGEYLPPSENFSWVEFFTPTSNPNYHISVSSLIETTASLCGGTLGLIFSNNLALCSKYYEEHFFVKVFSALLHPSISSYWVYHIQKMLLYGVFVRSLYVNIQEHITQLIVDHADIVLEKFSAPEEQKALMTRYATYSYLDFLRLKKTSIFRTTLLTNVIFTAATVCKHFETIKNFTNDLILTDRNFDENI